MTTKFPFRLIATSATRWVIVGVHGLYTGQWLTRREAIFHHCKDLCKSWEYCKKKGDRAVKATITYKPVKKAK